MCPNYVSEVGRHALENISTFFTYYKLGGPKKQANGGEINYNAKVDNNIYDALRMTPTRQIFFFWRFQIWGNIPMSN